jgi:hypothetical protein
MILQLPGVGQEGPDLRVLARFRDARSISVAPDGAVFVVEYGRSRVVRVDDDGTLSVLGLSARRPVAIDASAGLSLLVADAASGSVDRVGSDGNLILRVAVPTAIGTTFDYDPGFFEAESELSEKSAGLPADVARMSSGWLAVVEERLGGVLIWDESGRPVRALHAIDGIPLEPYRIAPTGNGLLVWTTGPLGLLRLDQFGTFAGRVSLPASGLRAIAGWENGFWLEAAGSLLEFGDSGELVATLPTGVPEEVVDLAVSRDAAFLLTATRLYRLALPTQ